MGDNSDLEDNDNQVKFDLEEKENTEDLSTPKFGSKNIEEIQSQKSDEEEIKEDTPRFSHLEEQELSTFEQAIENSQALENVQNEYNDNDLEFLKEYSTENSINEINSSKMGLFEH